MFLKNENDNDHMSKPVGSIGDQFRYQEPESHFEETDWKSEENKSLRKENAELKKRIEILEGVLNDVLPEYNAKQISKLLTE